MNSIWYCVSTASDLLMNVLIFLTLISALHGFASLTIAFMIDPINAPRMKFNL